MQLIWAETSKHFRSAAFFLLVLFFVVALLISPAYITNTSAIVLGTVASVLSMWVWWIANAKQVDLLDTVNPADSVGGDNTEAKLPGSLDEFRH